MSVKKQVRQFKRDFRMKTVNSAALCDALCAQGYTIVEFNGIDDDTNVRSLIAALQLSDPITHSKCFAYQNEKYRIVFIHEDLNEQERTIALAHEEGHIWNNHLMQSSIFGADIIQEFEANEFAHYLLKDKSGKKHRTAIIVSICAAIIIAGTATGIGISSWHNASIYTDNLYRTETGTKYHLRNCMYIKGKTDVYRLTKEEFESGEYEPCEACLPDKN